MTLVTLSVVLLFLAPTGGGQASAVDAARAALEELSTALRGGNYLKALPLAERAVDLAEKGDDRTVLARTLAGLGRARWGRGQYEPALQSYERAVTLFRMLRDRDGESEVLLRTGETLYSLGRYDDALAQYRLALEANAQSPSRSRESLIRSNVGVALRYLGRYEEAATSAEQAVAIARELGEESWLGQALVSLGIINRARAEYQQAIDAYTESIAIRRKLGDRRGEAQSLGNLGNVYNELGEYQKAIEAHTRSLALAQEVGYTAQVGFSTHNLASVLAQLGRESLPRFEQALAIWRQIDRQAEIPRTLREIAMQRLYGLGDAAGARAALDEALTIARRIRDRDAEGYVLLNLGSLELAAGGVRAALDRFEEGLTIARADGSPNLEFELLAERARARLRAGDTESAIADLRSSVAIVNDVRSRVTSDEARIAFVDTRQAVFRDLATTLASASVGRPIEALEAAEAGRARALADVLQSRLVRARPADQQTLQNLRSADAGSTPGILDRLRRQNQELASLVSADSARIDEIRATGRRLNATIVEYLVTPRALLAWVIAPNGDVHSVRTEVAEIRLIELTRAVLTALDTADPAASRPGAAAHGGLRELHRLVIRPLARWLPRAAADLLVIVPHGPLAQVPFAALEDAHGIPLIVHHTLSVAPSVSVFRYTSAKRRAPAPGRTSMVFASPAAPSESGLDPLPGSLDEGHRVASRLAPFAPTLLDGARASEHSAKTRLGGAAFVHFATHGLVSEIRPSDSSLVLAEGNGEDGYLRAAEVYSLELTADLVILSGCSTARGRLTGDGVFGLPRAFIYAGTPSVVASLWDVSDRATVFLMDRFYAELLRSGDKAGALRAAQLATRRRYPHPALWAAFVLIGEPR
jgi:CHAT domain-containing protein/predicted negative regulator of RcsB-dependent stress response